LSPQADRAAECRALLRAAAGDDRAWDRESLHQAQVARALLRRCERRRRDRASAELHAAGAERVLLRNQILGGGMTCSMRFVHCWRAASPWASGWTFAARRNAFRRSWRSSRIMSAR